MSIAANVPIVLIALLRFWFLILETFPWTGLSGRRAFGFSAEFAGQPRALAANQGLGEAVGPWRWSGAFA